MTEDLIGFETAKLAKEKGFKPTYIDHFFTPDGTGGVFYDGCFIVPTKDQTRPKYLNSAEEEEVIHQSTQSLLQKWLREEHEIEVEIRRGDDVINETTVKAYKYGVQPYNANWEIVAFNTSSYPTYEKALESGLQAALKLIK